MFQTVSFLLEFLIIFPHHISASSQENLCCMRTTKGQASLHIARKDLLHTNKKDADQAAHCQKTSVACEQVRRRSGCTLPENLCCMRKRKTQTRLHIARKPLLHANKKNADQPAHPHSLSSAFVIHLCENIKTEY